jgi:hypothetical protein
LNENEFSRLFTRTFNFAASFELFIPLLFNPQNSQKTHGLQYSSNLEAKGILREYQGKYFPKFSRFCQMDF